MNEVQRHNSILSLLDKKKIIYVSQIVDEFAVSPATARRDITKLDELGKLIKIRNGAERLQKEEKKWSPLDLNNTDFLEEKAKIAQKAADLCNKGDSVVINCGSTAFLLGQQLAGEPVQIVTNYFPLVNYLINEKHDDLIITGGQYNKEKKLFLNPDPNLLGNYAGNWMFTSGKGMTEKGLFKTDMLTAVTEQQMLNHIDKLVVVVDSSKIGVRTGMLFCEIKQIDILITGKNADKSVIKQIEAQGIQVILV